MPKVTKLQRGPQSWRLRIETKDANGQRAYAYETVKGTEAQAEARRLEIVRGLSPEGVFAPAPGTTLGQAFEAFVEERKAVQALADSSAAQYLIIRRLHLGELGVLPVEAITPERLKAHFATLGGRLNARTLQNVRRRISTVINHHIDSANLRIDNPVRKVKLGKVAPTAGQVLAPHELDRVLDACRGHHLGLLIRFALATGLRRGELCGLTWADVDLKRGVAHVRAQVHLEGEGEALQYVRTTELKTDGSRRSVGIPAGLLEDLRAEKAKHQEWATKAKRDVESLSVFLNAIGRAYSPGALSEAVRRFFVRLQLPCTVHDLRHIHATMLLRARHNPKAVSRRLGHSKVETTLSIYSHALPDDDASLTAEAGAIIDGGV